MLKFFWGYLCKKASFMIHCMSWNQFVKVLKWYKKIWSQVICVSLGCLGILAVQITKILQLCKCAAPFFGSIVERWVSASSNYQIKLFQEKFIYWRQASNVTLSVEKESYSTPYLSHIRNTIPALLHHIENAMCLDALNVKIIKGWQVKLTTKVNQLSYIRE